MPELFEGGRAFDEVGDNERVRAQFEAAAVGEGASYAFCFENVLGLLNDTHRGFICPSKRASGGSLVEACRANGVVRGARTKALAGSRVA